MFSYAGTSLE